MKKLLLLLLFYLLYFKICLGSYIDRWRDDFEYNYHKEMIFLIDCFLNFEKTYQTYFNLLIFRVIGIHH